MSSTTDSTKAAGNEVNRTRLSMPPPATPTRRKVTPPSEYIHQAQPPADLEAPRVPVTTPGSFHDRPRYHPLQNVAPQVFFEITAPASLHAVARFHAARAGGLDPTFGYSRKSRIADEGGYLADTKGDRFASTVQRRQAMTAKHRQRRTRLSNCFTVRHQDNSVHAMVSNVAALSVTCDNGADGEMANSERDRTSRDGSSADTAVGSSDDFKPGV